MKFKKIYFLVLITILLSGCMQSSALLGPGITIMTTGNVMQAGFQYGANSAIKKETGKDAITHLKNVVDEEKDSQKFETKMKKVVKNIFNNAKRN